MNKILMQPAWFYSCPKCSHANLVKGEKITLEEVQEYLASEEDPEFYNKTLESIRKLSENGEITACPRVVSCEECGEEYETDFGEEGIRDV